MAKQRYKVLEMDADGNLYLHKSPLLCVNEIIKRLTEGTYRTEPIMWLGWATHSINQTNTRIM